MFWVVVGGVFGVVVGVGFVFVCGGLYLLCYLGVVWFFCF